MKFLPKVEMHEKILIVLIIGAVILRLLLINQDISVLLNKFLSDDTYYAYSIAQNIISGKGIVFNDNIPTNGFHPFYNLAVLVPLFKIFYSLGINAPIYASLVVVTLFNIGTAVLLYLITSKILNKEAGLLSTFLWLFNPYVLFVSLIGLESSTQIFFIALLTYVLLTRLDRTQFSLKDSIIIGLLVGLVFLSRMDGVFIGFGVVATLFIRKLVKRSFKISLFDLIKQNDLIFISVTALMTITPWLLWSFVELGRITPISGEATRLLAASNLGDKSYIGLVKHSIYSTMGFIAKFFLNITDTIMQGVIVVSLALVPFAILLLKKDQVLLKLLYSLDFLAIGTVTLYLFYWFYQLGIREWYSMLTSFLLTIIFPITVVRLNQLFEPNKVGKLLSGFIIFILSVLFVIGGVTHYIKGNFPQEKLKWEVANFIDDNILQTEIIGSFNTGIYQYYTVNHDVVNLDGVMNPESLAAMKVSGIENYILAKNITYIVDRPYYAEQVNKSILSLEPIKTFEMQFLSYKNDEGKELIILFKVVPVS